MASIGSLVVNLVARTSQFRKGMRRASQRVAHFGKQTAFAGAKLAALGGVPMGLAIKGAADFQTAMSKVATQLDETNRDQLPRIREELAKTAVQYNRTADRSAQAMFDLLSSQIPVAKSLEMVKAGAILAAGGFTDMQTAMSTTNTLYQTYGDSLRDANDAADLLFKTQQRGRGTMEQFAQHMGTFIPVAENSGASMEEMAAAFASATQTMGAENIARVATGMRNMFSAFTDVRPGMAKAWDKHFSEPMSKATLQSEGLLSIMEKLATLDTQELTQIFPRRRARQFGVVPILQQMEHFRESLEQIGTGRAGAAMEALQERMDDLSYAAGRLWKAIQLQARAIGREYLPALTKTANALRQFVMENEGLFKILGSVAAGLAAVGSAMMVFGGMTWLIGSAVAGVQTLAASLGVVAAFAAPFAVFAGTLAAIGGSVYLIATRTDFLSDAWNALTGVIRGAARTTTRLLDIMAFLPDHIMPAWLQSFDAVRQGWSDVVRILTDDSLSWYESFVLFTNRAWRAWDVVSKAIATTWIKTVAQLKVAWLGFRAVFQSVIQGIVSGFESVVNISARAVNKLIDLANAAPGVQMGRLGQVELDVGPQSLMGGALSVGEILSERNRMLSGLERAMAQNERKRQARLQSAMAQGGDKAGTEAGKSMIEKLRDNIPDIGGVGGAMPMQQATLAAVRRGTIEGYKARIRRHTSQDPNERTAKNTDEMLKELRQLREAQLSSDLTVADL